MEARPNNARYLGRITVLYPLHPLQGREVDVFHSHRLDDRLHVEVQLEQRRLVIPLWMTDADRVEAMTLGVDPACSCQALLRLAKLLELSGL